MSVSQILQARVAERDSLLRRAVAQLTIDDRVCAAWLYGSFGRGTEDVWSDLDLWVVVEDDHIEAVCNERHIYATALARPLIMVDAPQNAPAGGGFLSVVYDGKRGGAQHVDWTWQAKSAAKIPKDARVLFNRAGIPEANPPTLQTPQQRAEIVAHQISFFWMMVPVVAKYIARRDAWGAISLLALLGSTLDQVKGLSANTSDAPGHPTKSRTLPPVQPEDQLAMLRDLASEMEALTAKLQDSNINLAPDATNQIYLFLNLVSDVIKAQDQRIETAESG